VRIAIIGAGAIGCGSGALLARAGHAVTLVGRPDQVAAIRDAGLHIEGCLGSFTVHPDATERLDSPPELALLTTKTQDVAEAARAHRDVLRDVPVVSIQNGLRGPDLAAAELSPDQVFAGVTLMTGSYLTPGRVHLQARGWLVIGRLNQDHTADGRPRAIAAVLADALPTSESGNIRGVQWLKLILNLNNSLSAVTGLDTARQFADPVLPRLGIRLMREALDVADRASVRLESLPDTSVHLIRLGRWVPVGLAARMAARKARALRFSGAALSSTLQSILRGQPTEIDYLNGEVVRLGERVGVPTPLNARAVELVHEVERTHRFYSPSELQQVLASSG
jgi:2-dehydropantoate 2-reductase